MNHQNPYFKASRCLPGVRCPRRSRYSRRRQLHQPAGAGPGQAGAGLLKHAGRLKPEGLRATVTQLLAKPSFRMAAGEVSEYFTANEDAERFPAFIQSCLPGATISTNGHRGSTAPENERHCRRVRSLSPTSPPEGESDEVSLRDVHVNHEVI